MGSDSYRRSYRHEGFHHPFHSSQRLQDEDVAWIGGKKGGKGNPIGITCVRGSGIGGHPGAGGEGERIGTEQEKRCHRFKSAWGGNGRVGLSFA